MRYAIGVDVGGTRIKAVAVDESGAVLDRRYTPTGAGSRADWSAAVARVIAEQERELGAPATWLGFASPGMPARDGLSIVSVHGPLAALAGARWDEMLGVTRRIPVLNDANAALLGETWVGAAAGLRDAMLLTLGTGVGGAVLSEGRLMRGHLGRAGHLGHICLDPDGLPDTTGLPGGIEDAIGERTIGRRSEGRFASTRDLVDAHLAGDEFASRVWLRSVYVFACAVASLINVVDPEVVIVGGGIARAGPALFEPLAAHLERIEWRPYGEGVRIVPAALGDLAGAIGAARNAIGI